MGWPSNTSHTSCQWGFELPNPDCLSVTACTPRIAIAVAETHLWLAAVALILPVASLLVFCWSFGKAKRMNSRLIQSCFVGGVEWVLPSARAHLTACDPDLLMTRSWSDSPTAIHPVHAGDMMTCNQAGWLCIVGALTVAFMVQTP